MPSKVIIDFKEKQKKLEGKKLENEVKKMIHIFLKNDKIREKHYKNFRERNLERVKIFHFEKEIFNFSKSFRTK